MRLYYVSFQKQDPDRTIRVEFVIRAVSKQQARLIAEKEARGLRRIGYRRFLEVD